jgi:hypothetical protein
MEKMLISVLSVMLVIGLASAAGGSFGEVASLNACHCLMFNSTNKANVWTLYSGFNTSEQFYIVKPNLTDTIITTSVTNGIIRPDSYYPINVTVVSNSPVNQSGYLSAYLMGSSTGSGGASVRLGANKLIEVKGTGAHVQTTNQTPLKGSVSTISTTIRETIQTTQNKSASSQAAPTNPVVVTSSIPSYLIGAIVVLFIIVCAMGYYIMSSKKTTGAKSNPKRKKGSYR